MDKLWQYGDIVVLRYVETPMSARIVHAIMGDPARPNASGHPFLVGGRVVTVQARPYRVVKDTDELTVLYAPEGNRLPRWLIDEQRYLPDPPLGRGRSLRLLLHGRAYDVTLFFEGEGELPYYYAGLFEGEGTGPGWRGGRRALGNSVDDGAPLGVPGRFRGWYVNMDLPVRRTSVGFDIVDQTLDIIVRPDGTWYWKDEDELALAVEKGACTVAHADWLRSAGEEVVKLIEAEASPFDDEWTSWRPPAGWSIETIPDGWQFLPALLDD